MTPVIRISDDVWKALQDRAKPFVDTPDDVLRRILNLDVSIPYEPNNKVDTPSEREVSKMKHSLWIVVNAVGKIADDKSASRAYRLTKLRVENGVDILSQKHFIRARNLEREAMILMHQGGAMGFRQKYGAGQLVAAGRIKEIARELTPEDKLRYRELYELTLESYPDIPSINGIIFYEFPKGILKQPLPKEKVPYEAGRGDKFLEVKPDDDRYAKLFSFWEANY